LTGTLHLRASEYTVGTGGSQAMPAPLPANSGYTYAVELSADEAQAAGATEVRFGQPLPLYVEHVLRFPVGASVPAGYYDRAKAAPATADGRLDEPCEQPGSIIECQNQTLGEVVGLTGAPMALHYRSDRVPGRTAANTLSIPLNGGSVPASTQRVDLEVVVAG